MLVDPGVELQIAFQEFQLAPFELRIPLLQDQTDTVDFEPQPIVFDMPPEEEPTGSTGEAGDSSGGDGDSTEGGEEGNSASGSDSGDGFGSSSTSGDATEADTDTDGGGGAADSGEGCGCTSGSDPGAILFLFALLGLRRRGLKRD